MLVHLEKREHCEHSRCEGCKTADELLAAKLKRKEAADRAKDELQEKKRAKLELVDASQGEIRAEQVVLKEDECKMEHSWSQHINPVMGSLYGVVGFDKSFVKAQGMHMYDSEGNKYLDFLSGHGYLPFGHHPKGTSPPSPSQIVQASNPHWFFFSLHQSCGKQQWELWNLRNLSFQFLHC